MPRRGTAEGLRRREGDTRARRRKSGETVACQSAKAAKAPVNINPSPPPAIEGAERIAANGQDSGKMAAPSLQQGPWQALDEDSSGTEETHAAARSEESRKGRDGGLTGY